MPSDCPLELIDGHWTCPRCGWIYAIPSARPPHRNCSVYQPGVGKELKRLFKAFGITPTTTCNCEQRSQLMDEEGPDWCEQNIDTIVRWLREEADERSLPLRIASRLPGLLSRIVRRAIRRTRKKLKALQR